MKTADMKVRMAYALGGATCGKDTDDRRKIDLKIVNEDWKDYHIAGNGSAKANNTYSLWYDGDFGSEKRYTRLMMIEEGWNLNHAVALFIAAIDMHKAELRNKTE